MKVLFTLILIAINVAQVRANECFDDKKLLGLLANDLQRGTLVYVWSPRMVYSAHNAAIASRAAAVAGLDFVVLHDMRVPDQELLHPSEPRRGLSVAQDAQPIEEMDLATPPFVSLLDNSRPMCSEQLIKREAFRHFPTAFVIGKQGVHANPIVGAMPYGAWVSSIKQRLASP